MQLRRGPLDGARLEVSLSTRLVVLKLDCGRKNGKFLWAKYEQDTDGDFYHLGTLDVQPGECSAKKGVETVRVRAVEGERLQLAPPQQDQAVRTYNWVLV